MEFIDKQTIKLDKELNALDQLVLRFISILKKYTDYVIISGYISILLGRSRATENVDIFIKELTKEAIKRWYDDLKANGFWCLNTDTPEEMEEYFKNNTALRFALEGQAIPNFEVKIARNKLSREIG